MSSCMRGFLPRRGGLFCLLAAAAVCQVQVSKGQEPANQSEDEANAAELKELVEALERDPESQAATQALRKIRQMKLPADKALSIYLRALTHGSPDTRWPIFLAIAEYKEDGVEAVDELVEFLNDAERDATDQHGAIRALGEIGHASPEVIATLHHFVTLGERDISRRRAALEALAKLGPPAKSCLPEIRPLVDSEYADIRAAAYEAVGRIETLPLPDDATAARRLSQLATLDPEEGYSLLEWVRARPDAAAKQEAVLLAAYGSDPCPVYVRRAIVQSMPEWSSGGFQAIRLLLAAYENQAPDEYDDRLRRLAEEALGNVKCDDARVVDLLVPRLIQISESERGETRFAWIILGLLEKLGPRGAAADGALAQLIESCTRRQRAWPRHRTLQAVAAIGPDCPHCADVLATLINKRPRKGQSHFDPVQNLFVLTLVEVGAEALTPVRGQVLDMLREANHPWEFAVAARSIGVLGGNGDGTDSEEVVAILTASLEQEGFRVDGMGLETRLDRLGYFSGSPEFTTTPRLEVIAALGRLGPAAGEAVPALERIVEREREKAAAKASLTPEEAILQEVGLLEALPPDADLKQVVADLELSPDESHVRPRFVPDELAAAEAALAAIRGKQ